MILIVIGKLYTNFHTLFFDYFFRALLLDFNDDQKPEKKPKKTLTNFFDEEHSDNENSNQGILDNDDDDDGDIDMEITWQPGLKSKAEQKFKNSNNQIEKKKNENKQPDKSNRVKAQIAKEDDSPENDQGTLELLTVDDDIDSKRDFNLRDMIKSHKQTTKAAAKNAKKTKKVQQNSSVVIDNKNDNDSFRLNVNDKRFQAVYNQPAFNIDQSDPHFKSTAGTQQLIDEKLKKRKLDHLTSSSRTDRDEDDIVSKLKRKSAKND
jgi:hypothetical protein